MLTLLHENIHIFWDSVLYTVLYNIAVVDNGHDFQLIVIVFTVFLCSVHSTAQKINAVKITTNFLHTFVKNHSIGIFKRAII
jgi:hypothetical protein